MGRVVACRTVRDGTGGGGRDHDPVAMLLLDGVQLKAVWVGKKGLHMARGRSHLPLDHKTFHLFDVLGHLEWPNRAPELRESPKLTQICFLELTHLTGGPSRLKRLN
jgi:hypothetical protein